MATELEALLDRIHPTRTIDSVARRVDEAFNAFRREQSTVSSIDDLEECVRRFGALVLHRVCETQGLDESSESSLYGGGVLARNALEKEYGRDWRRTVLDVASRGTEGGLYGTLKKIAQNMAEEFARNRIGSLVGEYLGGLSSEQRRKAAEEYVRRYGSLFDIDEMGALLTQGYFGKILNEHPWLIKRLEQAGRW